MLAEKLIRSFTIKNTILDYYYNPRSYNYVGTFLLVSRPPTKLLQVNLYDIAGFPTASSALADNIQEWIKTDNETEQDDYLFGSKKEFIYSKLLLNGQTTAENIQLSFERNLNKLGRDLMGPPIGKTVIS